MTHFYLEIDWRWESVPKKVLWLLTSFRRYVWGMSLKLLDHTRRHCCRNSCEKLQLGFIITGMRSYLLKEQLQMQSTGTLFCISLWIIKCYSNFIASIYFSLDLIRWNSTHCHLIYLMELFKSKESLKEKVDSNNNWTTAWPRMILEWHLFLRLSLGFVRKMLSFVGEHLSITQKMSVHFLYFYLNEEELKQQVCLIKYVENEISNSSSHKKKRGAKT